MVKSIIIVLVSCVMAMNALGGTPDVLSNGLVEIRIHAERGRFDVIDLKRPQSLTAGGLTYTDFRKYVQVNGNNLVMYADDPVGKRVDPGHTYKSADRFYLDGQTDNPFESLEAYAVYSQEARDIDLHYYTFPSTCMWFLAVNHFGADTGSRVSNRASRLICRNASDRVRMQPWILLILSERPVIPILSIRSS